MEHALQSVAPLHACSLEEELMNSIQIDTGLHRAAALLVSLLLGPALTAQAQDAKTRAPSVPQGVRASAPASQSAASASGVLNLNTANVEELTRLPGVGPSRAQAIIELRTRMKGFKSVEDIMRVRGIGRKTYRKLEPMLRLQGTTTLTEVRRPSASAPAATTPRS
jgi:competence protein ComEA